MNGAQPLVVIGAGGFGREVLDVVDAINASASDPVWHVEGVIDDSPRAVNLERLAARNVRYLGRVDDVCQKHDQVSFAVGVGSPIERRRIAERLEAAGLRPATLVHPSATRGFDVAIGEGSIICAGVRLTTNIRIGRYVHVNLNATIGHDSVIGDYVSLNPLASVSGDCVLESGVLVGVGAVVLNGLSVGQHATIGGSACVVRNVPSEVVVVGVPAVSRARRESP